jgi:FKBP-type peptidyl-prolyl cis-trans isomerase FkpA
LNCVLCAKYLANKVGTNFSVSDYLIVVLSNRLFVCAITCCRIQLKAVSRNKYIILGVLIVVAGLSASGYFWWSKNEEQKQAQIKKTSPYTLGSSTGKTSMTLNDAPEDTSPSGLNVDQIPQGTDLGQLDTSGGQGSSSGSESKKQTSPFDPSTFKQYDKYLSATSGLFADVQKGTGAELVNNKKAAVYYKGWLTNGALFDESKKDDKGALQPFVFAMGAKQVIPGWEQALYGMKVGGVRLVIVPPSAGYGPNPPQGSGIPPNSVLMFQVQLAAVE